MIDAIPLHRRPTPCPAMINSIVAMMEPYASDIGVTLTAVVDADVPASLSLDEDKIAWAIGTLVGNALRHVPRGSYFHGGGEITVHASRPANSGEIVIAVIPEEKLPLLFQPAPYQRRVGYALILAREIAAAHGGRMEVESSTDPLAHGTTIRMVLPAD